MIPGLEQLRFPIGHFVLPDECNQAIISNWISQIRGLVPEIRFITKDLPEESASWRYRRGGWTIKQLINHCIDSHMNSIIRFKLALTEDHPTIRPYREELWAELPDALSEDLESALLLLNGIQERLADVLTNIRAEDWDRTFFHPEHERSFTIKENIGIYAWHGKHHLEHIKLAVGQKGVNHL